MAFQVATVHKQTYSVFVMLKCHKGKGSLGKTHPHDLLQGQGNNEIKFERSGYRLPGIKT